MGVVDSVTALKPAKKTTKMLPLTTLLVAQVERIYLVLLAKASFTTQLLSVTTRHQNPPRWAEISELLVIACFRIRDEGRLISLIRFTYLHTGYFGLPRVPRCHSDYSANECNDWTASIQP